MSLNKIKKELSRVSDPERAKKNLRFFKTGKGEYAEGDRFIGIGSPIQRKIAKENIETKLKDIQELLNSEIHEYRQTALLILVYKFQNKKKSRGNNANM